MAFKNTQFKKDLDSASQKDVIIVFNAGGWGYASIEKADDLTPIIYGVQEVIKDLGHETVIIPYQRAKNDFLGRLESTKELFSRFKKQSGNLAKELNDFLINNSRKSIIMVGLSGGAAFVEETMKKIPESIRGKIYAIEAGLPFFIRPSDSKNILRLNNNDRDSVSKGRIGDLLISVLKMPLNWIIDKTKGGHILFSKCFKVPGHFYPWESAEVGAEIAVFLKVKLFGL